MIEWYGHVLCKGNDRIPLRASKYKCRINGQWGDQLLGGKMGEDIQNSRERLDTHGKSTYETIEKNREGFLN